MREPDVRPFRVIYPWRPLQSEIAFCLALYHMVYVAPLGGKVKP